MKKVYIYALLTIITTLSTSCMEQGNYSQPGYTEPHWIYTGSQYSVTPVPVASHYQPTQYDSYMHIPIIPIPMMRTITIQPSYAKATEGKPDQKIVQRLYDDAYQFFSNTDASKLIENYDNFKCISCKQTLYLSTSQKLAQLIHALGKSENDNINAHVMEQFAYNQQSISQKNSIYATLLFNLLKTYKITTHQTNEQLPFQPDATESCLMQTFCVPVNTSNTKNIPHTHTTYAQQYPAFSDLLHKLYRLLTYSTIEHCRTLTALLNSTQPITTDDYSEGTYTNSHMDFYTTTCTLLTKSNNTSIPIKPTYELVQIIEKATDNNDICEYTFGKNILKLKPEASLLNNILSSDFPLFNRQIAALLYKQIQNYHIARGNKITPTPKQYMAYLMTEDFKFVVPALLNNSMLNSDTYAFDEFKELRLKIIILLASTEKEIQECIDQIYNC